MKDKYSKQEDQVIDPGTSRGIPERKPSVNANGLAELPGQGLPLEDKNENLRKDDAAIVPETTRRKVLSRSKSSEEAEQEQWTPEEL